MVWGDRDNLLSGSTTVRPGPGGPALYMEKYSAYLVSDDGYGP